MLSSAPQNTPEALSPRCRSAEVPLIDNRHLTIYSTASVSILNRGKTRTEEVRAQELLTSSLTISCKSGMLRSAFTKGILSTSSGKGRCFTLYLSPTSFLGAGRGSGTKVWREGGSCYTQVIMAAGSAVLHQLGNLFFPHTTTVTPTTRRSVTEEDSPSASNQQTWTQTGAVHCQRVLRLMVAALLQPRNPAHHLTSKQLHIPVQMARSNCSSF